MVRALGLLLALLAAACGPDGPGTRPGVGPGASAGAPPAPRPLVVASVYPLYEFARHVAGDAAEVAQLVPAGVEPHDWEPAPQDVARLERARLFIYNGAGFEPWAARLVATLGERGPAVVVATEGLELVAADLPHDETHGARRGPPAGEARKDPHVWLDPVRAQAQVEHIRAGLARVDPEHAGGYTERARAFTASLDALHRSFERGLAGCTRREIVTAHSAFTYLARRYGLRQVPLMGVSPDAEPSSAALAELTRFARAHGVRYVFFETLVSRRLADTLAREVGARTLVLDPIEGVAPEAPAAGRGYLALMESNLANLRTALDCP